MRKIVVDTNFLLLPLQFNIDIFSEIEGLMLEPYVIIVPSGVLRELRKLSSKKGKDGRAALFALKTLGEKGVSIEKSSGGVDDWLCEYAKRNKAVVCTNDINLRNRLKGKNIKVIAMKGKSKLAFC
jgi:hypothetical protein